MGAAATSGQRLADHFGRQAVVFGEQLRAIHGAEQDRVSERESVR